MKEQDMNIIVNGRVQNIIIKTEKRLK